MDRRRSSLRLSSSLLPSTATSTSASSFSSPSSSFSTSSFSFAPNSHSNPRGSSAAMQAPPSPMSSGNRTRSIQLVNGDNTNVVISTDSSSLASTSSSSASSASPASVPRSTSARQSPRLGLSRVTSFGSELSMDELMSMSFDDFRSHLHSGSGTTTSISSRNLLSDSGDIAGLSVSYRRAGDMAPSWGGDDDSEAEESELLALSSMSPNGRSRLHRMQSRQHRPTHSRFPASRRMPIELNVDELDEEPNSVLNHQTPPRYINGPQWRLQQHLVEHSFPSAVSNRSSRREHLLSSFDHPFALLFNSLGNLFPGRGRSEMRPGSSSGVAVDGNSVPFHFSRLRNRLNAGGDYDHPMGTAVDMSTGETFRYPLSEAEQIAVFQQLTDNEEKKTEGLSEGHRQTLRAKHVKAASVETIRAKETCPICLEQFTGNTAIMQLPKCNHQFCRDCILHWLESHTNCPVCRDDIKAAIHNRKRRAPSATSSPPAASPSAAVAARTHRGRLTINNAGGGGTQAETHAHSHRSASASASSSSAAVPASSRGAARYPQTIAYTQRSTGDSATHIDHPSVQRRAANIVRH